MGSDKGDRGGGRGGRSGAGARDDHGPLPANRGPGEGSGVRGPVRGEVEAFLDRLAAAPVPSRARGGRGRTGRLVFAIDATASREPTWDRAMGIQAEMFREAASLGGLEIQLVYYRGLGECRASRWVGEAGELLRLMQQVACRAGPTQIGRVLDHTAAVAAPQAGRAGGAVDALVFVGDCVEEEIDHLAATAGQLGLLGVPAFLFHEGDDATAARAFRHIARLTGGACCRFDSGSPDELRALLKAVAVFAAGGRQALVDYGTRAGGAVLALTHQMTRGSRR